MNVRIGIVQLNVTDLQQAWEFYVDTLGMEGDWSFGHGNPFKLMLGPAEGLTVLVYPVESLRQHSYPSDTGVVLVFYTDGIDRTILDWQTKGVEFVPIEWSQDASGVAASPFGRFIAFRDPFGNVHELLEPSE